MELDRAVNSGGESSIGIRDIDFREPRPGAGCNASAIRVTLPGKVRSGISGTRTTASIPGCSPNASSCGANTRVRMKLPCMILKMNVPLVAPARICVAP
jgi:hypothetical protein